MLYFGSYCSSYDNMQEYQYLLPYHLGVQQAQRKLNQPQRAQRKCIQPHQSRLQRHPLVRFPK